MLVPKALEHIVMDVRAKPETALNSDHAIVVTTLRIKMVGKPKEEKDKVLRYRSPTDEEKKAHKEEIKQNIQEV